MDVDKMQTKLATWSQDPGFRFDDIYNLLYEEDWLRRAQVSVKSNSGSQTAGIDGETMRDFEEDLDGNLKDLRKSLKSESFVSRPLRRTYIPKGDGRKRPLGIPTIKDRIVQEALRMALEPIYETDFGDNSYGFRPNRSTHDAIMAVRMQMTPAQSSYFPWVIDADIKGFFDNVDHGTLGKILQNRITDRKILALIWKFLKAGIMEEGTFRHSMLGTPQGGIVSPLLANIYLNKLDQWAGQWTDLTAEEKRSRRRRGKGNWMYVRYADDFLFLGNGTKKRAERMMERVEDYVAEELSLTISDEKSSLIHATDGLSFLGYDLKARVDTGGVSRRVPKESKRDLKAKIREATEGETEVSSRAKMNAVNAVLRGWANYYKYATDAASVFNGIHHYAWHRMTRWLAKKYRCTRSELVSRKLDNRDPISINGVSMVDIQKLAEKNRKSPYRHEHPYLEGENTGRETLPEERPWLAGKEERTGWKDARWSALERDDWNCRKCGRNLEGLAPHVHHQRPYKGYGDTGSANRLTNLVSLCSECHRQVESNHYADV